MFGDIGDYLRHSRAETLTGIIQAHGQIDGIYRRGIGTLITGISLGSLFGVVEIDDMVDSVFFDSLIRNTASSQPVIDGGGGTIQCVGSDACGCNLSEIDKLFVSLVGTLFRDGRQSGKVTS